MSSIDSVRSYPPTSDSESDSEALVAGGDQFTTYHDAMSARIDRMRILLDAIPALGLIAVQAKDSDQVEAKATISLLKQVTRRYFADAEESMKELRAMQSLPRHLELVKTLAKDFKKVRATFKSLNIAPEEEVAPQNRILALVAGIPKGYMFGVPCILLVTIFFWNTMSCEWLQTKASQLSEMTFSRRCPT